MFLARGHNAATPVWHESAAPRSRVKHSTTEPLHSLLAVLNHEYINIVLFVRRISFSCLWQVWFRLVRLKRFVKQMR